MVNKIKSAIGGLAMLAATATGSQNVYTNDSGVVYYNPNFTAIEYVQPDSIFTNGSYKISMVLYAGDTNKYDVLTSSDLRNTNSWVSSISNTNLAVKPFLNNKGMNTLHTVREPNTSTNVVFKLKSRGN